MRENESYQNLLRIVNELSDSELIGYMEYGAENMEIDSENRTYFSRLFDKTKREVEKEVEKFGFKKQPDGYWIYESDRVIIVYHPQMEKPFNFIINENDSLAVSESERILEGLTKILGDLTWQKG